MACDRSPKLPARLRNRVLPAAALPVQPLSVLREERGTALVLALLTSAFLGAVASGLVLLTSGELLIAAHHRDTHETEAAAGAALDLTVAELQQIADWDLALSGGVQAGFFERSGSPVLADGTRIDLAAATSIVQASSATASWGSDRPRWTLFVAGRASALLPGRAAPADLYLLGWVADDSGDGDGNPTVDSNGIVQVWAEARGPAGRRHALRGVYARVSGPPAPLRRLARRHES